jgi:hypothetical protein
MEKCDTRFSPLKILCTIASRSIACINARRTRTSLNQGLSRLKLSQLQEAGLMYTLPFPCFSHCSRRIIAPSKEIVLRMQKSTSPASTAARLVLVSSTKRTETRSILGLPSA